MNAVTNTASVNTSATDSPRVPSIASEETLTADAHNVAAQLFTYVLAEQTLKTPKAELAKAELGDRIVPKSEQDAHPAMKPKKTTSIDAPTQLFPLTVPIVAEIAFVVTTAVPLRTGANLNDQSKIGLVQKTSKTQPEVEVKVPSPVIPELSLKPGGSAPAATTNPLTDQKVITTNPLTDQKVITTNPLTDQKVITTNPLTDQKVITTNPLTDQKVITTYARILGGNRAVTSAPMAHLSQSVPEVAVVATNLEHRRDPSNHDTSRFGESVIAPLAIPLLHSQPLGTALPASPISGSISGPTASSASATAPMGQSLAHGLNVGELAGAISRPMNEGNGAYTVRIAMHPADLGHLQAVVTLRGNDLQVSLTPQTQQGRDALTNAVHTLKEELSRGGVNVNVTLHDPGFQSRGEDRPPNPAARGEILPHEETTLQPLPSPVPSANQIDLRL
jgi:flagellar hook-length control protein FliK